MKLLFQSDDFGISKAVTLGIMEGIEKGLIRNTGLFTNMPSSEFAASQIKKFPECCFGIDINLVAGKPISDPKNIPSLVDKNGNFITSIQRYEEGHIVETNGISTVFEEDPYVYEEVCIEMEAQIKKYIELVGHNPEYLHPHSLITPNIEKAFRVMAKKYNIPLSMNVWQDSEFVSIPGDWNIKPVFTIEAQKDTDVESKILELIENYLDKDKVLLICHAGYIDADIMDLSSYTVIRTQDLRMATSNKLIDILKSNNVELITYRDIA